MSRCWCEQTNRMCHGCTLLYHSSPKKLTMISVSVGTKRATAFVIAAYVDGKAIVKPEAYYNLVRTLDSNPGRTYSMD